MIAKSGDISSNTTIKTIGGNVDVEIDEELLLTQLFDSRVPTLRIEFKI
jgi:hypothetical protein